MYALDITGDIVIRNNNGTSQSDFSGITKISLTASKSQNSGMVLQYEADVVDYARVGRIVMNNSWGGVYSDFAISTRISQSGELHERFRVKANGRIGIGTSKPTCLLDVNGSLRANEIKVSSSSGADFVFEEGYNLRSLEEVSNFISTNKHLPEIPSAEEMEKEGVDLARLNIQLLQKIEELTLYTIEQEKEIKLMRENYSNLMQEVKYLKSMFNTKE